MPEIASCPQCQRQLRIPDELLGRSVKCPSCGTTFTGSAATPPPPSAPPVAVFSNEPGSRPAAPPADFQNLEFDDNRGPRGGGPPFRRDAAPHRGVLILVFGILSLVIWPVGIFLGPAAWIMGNSDLAEIRAGRMDREGEGLTQAGRICGMIASIMILAGCICYAGFFAIIIGTASAR